MCKDGFKYLSQDFKSKILGLVKQNVFYPYEYMSDSGKFQEELQGNEKFYSSLTGKNNCYKKYEHVLKVWNTFQMKTMKDYYELYSKSDVLLLAGVFQNFRNNGSKNDRLCPNHYVSASLSWDIILNTPEVELERVPDTEMYLFFEKDMRGGVLFISKIYSKANSKYLKFYDPKQETKYIIYLDANKIWLCHV